MIDTEIPEDEANSISNIIFYYDSLKCICR